jgi:uncharacterized membrane protein YfcA
VRGLDVERVWPVAVCVAAGAVVGMFTAHMLTQLFWAVLAVVVLLAVVRLWIRSVLSQPEREVRWRD